MIGCRTAEEIGEVLRHARRARGLTQAHAAELVGTSPRLWNEMENGKRDHVSITTLLAMLQLVRVQLVLLDHCADGGSRSAFREPSETAHEPAKLPPPAEPEPPPATAAPLVSGQRVNTGTGAGRRRLTLEEAEAGALPEPMTCEEWAAMAAASTPAPVPAPTPEPSPEPAPPTAAAAKPRDRTPRTVVSPSPQLRALTLLAAGMSVYRVAAVMDLPFDVVHRWSVDARRAAKESTAA